MMDFPYPEAIFRVDHGASFMGHKVFFPWADDAHRSTHFTDFIRLKTEAYHLNWRISTQSDVRILTKRETQYKNRFPIKDMILSIATHNRNIESSHNKIQKKLFRRENAILFLREDPWREQILLTIYRHEMVSSWITNYTLYMRENLISFQDTSTYSLWEDHDFRSESTLFSRTYGF